MVLEVSNGNLKIGSDTLIYNITSAEECVSRALGLCQIPDKCYARKAERLYKAVLPYRKRQTKYWDNTSAYQIAMDFNERIIHLNGYREKNGGELIKYIRIGESGDFRHQADVDKSFRIANHLANMQPELTIYGFTARMDLNFEKRPWNYTLNGSAFMIDNSFTVVPKDTLKFFENVCAGNCRICDLCKEKKGLSIYVGIH
jgi:hypothetical protein